jgi:hypothetical protein
MSLSSISTNVCNIRFFINLPPPIIIPLALGVLAPSLLGTSAWLFNGELAPPTLPPCWL